MGIRMVTPASVIDRVLEEKVAGIREQLFRMLCYVGEQCRNTAIEKGSYKDRTFNLRSSVGYVVVDGGIIRSVSDFGGGKANSEEGKRAGKTLAMDLARMYGDGMVLIVVAGMDYAVYVAAKGKDVLDSARLRADRIVPEMLKKLKL